MAKKVSDELYANLKLYMDEEELLNYESFGDINDDAAIVEYVREYYNKHLPVDVHAWRQVNHFLSRDDEIEEQINFMLEQIASGFYNTSRHYLSSDTVQVLGTHLAEGNGIFPIFKVDVGQYYDGLKIIASCTGEEWFVSFKLNEPLKEFDHMYFFDPLREFDSDFPHLPKDEIYSTFDKSQKEFTVQFYSKFDFYAFCMILKKHLEY